MALKNKKNSDHHLGATDEAGRAREADFKSRLKKFFPDIGRIDFQYTEIKKKKGVTGINVTDEGCFGYFMKESILVDGKPISIAWLPHIKDMPPTYIEVLVDRVQGAMQEVLIDLGNSSDNASISIG